MRKPESDRNIVYTKIFGSTLKGFQLKSLILECLGVEVRTFIHHNMYDNNNYNHYL